MADDRHNSDWRCNIDATRSKTLTATDNQSQNKIPADILLPCPIFSCWQGLWELKKETDEYRMTQKNGNFGKPNKN